MQPLITLFFQSDFPRYCGIKNHSQQVNTEQMLTNANTKRDYMTFQPLLSWGCFSPLSSADGLLHFQTWDFAGPGEEWTGHWERQIHVVQCSATAKTLRWADKASRTPCTGTSPQAHECATEPRPRSLALSTSAAAPCWQTRTVSTARARYFCTSAEINSFCCIVQLDTVLF